MARKIEISVDEHVYIGDTAPARDQVEMLALASQNGLLPVIAEGVGDMAVVAAMSTLSMPVLERLTELVVRKGNIVRAADGVPVSANLFQDQIHQFFLLIGRGLRANIGPFWQLNTAEKGDGVTTAEKQN